MNEKLKTSFVDGYLHSEGFDSIVMPNGTKAPKGLVKNYGSAFYDLFTNSVNDKKINQRLNLKDKVILDIGCGSGKFCYDAVNSFSAKKAYGIDIASVNLGITDSYASDVITFFEGDSTEIPLDDNTVDIVTSFLVLEHIPKEYLLRVLSEMNRVSKEGWILAIHHMQSHNKHGEPARLTVKKLPWWKKQMSNYMSDIEQIEIASDNSKWGKGDAVGYSRTVSTSKKFGAPLEIK